MTLRQTLATLLATATLALSAGSALAGIVPLATQYREALDAAAVFTTKFASAITPLYDYSSVPQTAGACHTGTPRAHALLIGSNKVLTDAPTADLLGPENDVDLLAAAFAARLGSDADIVALKGDAATRAGLHDAIAGLLARVQCGDLVTFYFTGHGTDPTAPLADIAKLDLAVKWALKRPADDPTHVTAAAVTALEAARLGMLVSGGTLAHPEMISARDVNDFVSVMRNRHADVMVLLDAPHAGAAHLLERQQAADATAGWSLSPAAAPDVPLIPDRGDFVVYYSSLGDENAVEKKFVMPDGHEVTHGAFSFAVAEVLQDSAVVTARSLGERLLPASWSNQIRANTYTAEGSNPDMRLFGRSAALERLADAIHITSPEPTRGPASVKSSAIEIAGTVSWTSPVTAVLVNGELAELGQNGRFTRKLALVNGANTIRVVALTRDNLLLQKSLDVVFAGDVDALKGSGKRYAVIIGNADYGAATGFNALATPIADADALEAVLTGKYGFTTAITLPSGQPASLSLRNASGRDTQMALYNVSQVAGDNDTVLIYYAGHGIYEPMTTTAFWVPTDAVAGVPPTYLSASTISEAIARIQARKVLLISDSCFSGALLRGGPPQAEKIDADKRLDALLALQKRKSRILISSGNNEPVSDAGGDGHSIFAQALLNGLDNEDHDEFSARELFDGYILTAVAANSKQEPQFRPLDNVGHDGGDVIFLKVGS
jgi:uncharacterized caspase-like protein